MITDEKLKERIEKLAQAINSTRQGENPKNVFYENLDKINKKILSEEETTLYQEFRRLYKKARRIGIETEDLY